MATPNAISTIYDSTFVSSFDLHKPQVLNTLFKKYGAQGIAYLTIRSLGFETPVKGDTYGHHEEDLWHDIFKQDSAIDVADPTAGVDIVLTLDVTKIDTAGHYYVRLNDVITFPNETQGWVRNIAVVGPALQVTVRPLDIASTCGAVPRGTELIITSGLFSEGSGMPDPAAAGYEYYDNDAQIIKEAIGVTGSELVNETYIDVFNEANEKQGVYRAGQAQLDYRMLTKIDGMFWLGQRVDNTANRAIDPVSGYPYKGSEGFIPFLRRKGNVNPYTVGAFSVDEFDSYDLTLEKNFVATDIPLWTPLAAQLYQEMENTLVTYFADTNIAYARQAVNDMLFKSNEALGASVNWKYLQKSSRTYLFHKLSGFSNPKTFGAVGYDFEKMGFIVPIETRRDPKSKNDIPSIGTRYRAMGAYNRRMITDTLSGIGATPSGGRPVHTIDKANTYQMCHLGNEFFGGNRMILVDPT